MEISIHSYTTFLIKTSNIDFVRFTNVHWDYYVDEWYVIVSVDEMIEIMKLYSEYALEGE